MDIEQLIAKAPPALEPLAKQIKEGRARRQVINQAIAIKQYNIVEMELELASHRKDRDVLNAQDAALVQAFAAFASAAASRP